MQQEIFRVPEKDTVEQISLRPKRNCPGLFECLKEDGKTILPGIYYNAQKNWLVSHGRILMINDRLVLIDEGGVAWTTDREVAEDMARHFDELW